MSNKYIIDEYGRECITCKIYKVWNEFYKSTKIKTGHQPKCKQCSAAWSKENKDSIRNRRKDYYMRNKERIDAKNKENRINNKQKYAEYLKKHKKRIYAQQKKYRDRPEIKEKYKNTNKAYWESYAKYSVSAHKLAPYQYVEEGSNDTLIVECTYCGKKHIPTNNEIYIRTKALNRADAGEGNIYCSHECKQACPTYWRITKRKDDVLLYEILDAYVRREVFKRDNYTCQKCLGVQDINNPLHCHHIIPIKLSYIESNDINNLITLCKKCHYSVHKEIEGCGFRELATCI